MATSRAWRSPGGQAQGPAAAVRRPRPRAAAQRALHRGRRPDGGRHRVDRLLLHRGPRRPHRRHPAEGRRPVVHGDWEKWNYVVGFGLFFVGLLLCAHPSTPLGRGRGVVVGMLACFLLGLLWICTFYVLSGDQLPKVAIFNDLGQWNLVVGIGFMAVGFSFATRWE